MIAKTIAGISLIGIAPRTLEQAGWDATITGNRITVDGTVEAQLVSTNGRGWWQVYSIDGVPPVWVVSATTEPTNWLGAVES